jgi:hypothetical protein
MGETEKDRRDYVPVIMGILICILIAAALLIIFFRDTPSAPREEPFDEDRLTAEAAELWKQGTGYYLEAMEQDSPKERDKLLCKAYDALEAAHERLERILDYYESRGIDPPRKVKELMLEIQKAIYDFPRRDYG